MGGKPSGHPFSRALVFEGGGARGAFQAGVLRYLADHPEDFPVDLVCGTSIGAVHAAAFAFGKVDELFDMWGRLEPQHAFRRRSWRELAWELVTRKRFTHLYDVRPFRQLLESLFGERRMADSPRPLLISAFNLQSGQAEVFDQRSPIRVVDALLASTAIQGLFPPHFHRGFQYLDGGNVCNLPLGPVLAAGARDLLVVRTSAPAEFLPALFRDIVSIQKRAYSILVERTTTADLSRAQELSEVLARAHLQRAQWRERLEKVRDPEERADLLAFLEALPCLVPGRCQLRLRTLEPPPGALLPDLLELHPQLSSALLHLGYQRAALLLEDSEIHV